MVEVIDGVAYVPRDGYLYRYFVTVDEAGQVIGDVEIGRLSWEGVVVPATLIDVTEHPQWAGVGSLVNHTRNAKDEFVAPIPIMKKSPEQRMDELETKLDSILAKFDPR